MTVVDEPCRWCGNHHGKLCPAVKALEYDSYGMITRVEFLTPADMVRQPPPEDEPQPYTKL